ncbi:hypothetical protein M0R72_06005 [Candidatus Pacearchaeota archaeon]|jgi:hypothetical protein|nr:hypothetical protein [Candidatus Pacearchaeota archaeon]
MQNIFFLVKGQQLVLGGATLKVTDITDSNQIKFDVVCSWKFNDTLTHQETIAEGSELVYDVSPNYMRVVVRSIAKAASFGFANIAVDYDKSEETGNLQLDAGNPLYVKGISTATISYSVPFGGRLVITKPSGVTIVDTPTLGGAQTYTLSAANLDEIGMWKATVMESGESSPQIVKLFRVVVPPTSFSHIVDVVFKAATYQNVSDIFTLIQSKKDKIESEIAEVMDHFGLQYMSLGVVAGTSSDYTIRILANMGSNRDTEAIVCSIIDMLSVADMGSPVGYVYTTRSTSSQDKITFNVGDVLSIMKAAAKTKFDREYDTPTHTTSDLTALATSEKKLYADIFPSATVDPMNQAISSIGALDSSTETKGHDAIKSAKSIFMEAVRSVEDSATTAYSVHDVPLEHTTVDVSSDIPGSNVVATTGAPAAVASTLSISSITGVAKEHWKLLTVIFAAVVITVILRAKGKTIIGMLRRNRE